MASGRKPPSYTAHFPRTRYDTVVSNRSGMLKHIRADIEEMSRRGFVGAANGSTLDDYPGLMAYHAEVVDDMRQRMNRLHQSVHGRPVEESDFQAAMASDPATKNMLMGILADYMSVLNFEKAGKKVFHFSPNLVDRLAATAMDAPAEYLRLPFESCLFVMQSRSAIDALYQIGHEQPWYDAPLSIFLSEHHFMGMRKIMIQIFHSTDTHFRTFVKRELLINPKWTIERSLRTDWTNLVDANPDWAAGDDDVSVGDVVGHCDDESIFYEDGLHFFRILVNAILYLASSDPDLSLRASPVAEMRSRAAATLNGYKKHELLQHISHYSELDGNIVGGNVAPIVVEPGRPATSLVRISQGSASSKRFIVRGHWRNQAHGEGMADRKLIWIQPYWKGPEMADVVGRPYVVR